MYIKIIKLYGLKYDENINEIGIYCTGTCIYKIEDFFNLDLKNNVNNEVQGQNINSKDEKESKFGKFLNSIKNSFKRQNFIFILFIIKERSKNKNRDKNNGDIIKIKIY